MILRRKYTVRIKPHHWGDEWAVLEVWRNGEVIGSTDVTRNNLTKSYIRYRAKEVFANHKHKQKASKMIQDQNVLWK